MSIPELWCARINYAAHKRRVLNSDGIEIVNPEYNGSVSPHIIIFDPFTSVHIYCPDHDVELNPTELWTDGETSSRQPRLIYDVTGPAYMVTRLYICKAILGTRSHHMRTYEQKILEQSDKSNAKIFQFSHKRAATVQFLTMITSLAIEGMSFSQIENHIRTCAHTHLNLFHMKDTVLENCYLKLLPNAEELQCLFLSWYWENEPFYYSNLIQLDSKILTADHTFKIAANIGISDKNKKWVKLYNSVVFIMNENKEIVAWKFCERESYSIITDLLNGIKERDLNKKYILPVDMAVPYETLTEDFDACIPQIIESDSSKIIEYLLSDITTQIDINIDTYQVEYPAKSSDSSYQSDTVEPEKSYDGIEFFIVDDCCKSRNKIQDVFGKDCNVKLDPYHAIARITGVNSKNSVYHRTVCFDVKDLLRDSNDVASPAPRSLPTADVDQIMKKLDYCVIKWRELDQRSEGDEIILTDVMKKAIENLSKHIQKGCLSGIPLASSSANENLHKNMNRLFKGVKRGPEISYAILDTFIYKWNTIRQSKIPNFSAVDNRVGSFDRKEKFGLGKLFKSPDVRLHDHHGMWSTRNLPSEGLLNLYSKVDLYNVLSRKMGTINPWLFFLSDSAKRSVLMSVERLPSNSIWPHCNNFITDGKCNADKWNLVHSVAHQIGNLFEGLDRTTNSLRHMGFSENVDSNFQMVVSLLENKFDRKSIIELVLSIANSKQISIIIMINEKEVPFITFFPALPIGSIYIEFNRCSETFVPIKVPNLIRKMHCSCTKSKCKDKCPCLANELACSNCQCFSCENEYGTRPNQVTSNRKRRKPQSLDTFRYKSSDFLSLENNPAVKSTWSIGETLILINILCNSKEEDLDSTGVHKYFNSDIDFLSDISDMYNVSVKSLNSIAAKTKSLLTRKKSLEVSLLFSHCSNVFN